MVLPLLESDLLTVMLATTNGTLADTEVKFRDCLLYTSQESCGIALNVDGVLSGHRDLGLVSEVFTNRVLEELPRGAKMATGHVRYLSLIHI